MKVVQLITSMFFPSEIKVPKCIEYGLHRVRLFRVLPFLSCLFHNNKYILVYIPILDSSFIQVYIAGVCIQMSMCVRFVMCMYTVVSSGGAICAISMVTGEFFWWCLIVARFRWRWWCQCPN